MKQYIEILYQTEKKKKTDEHLYFLLQSVSYIQKQMKNLKKIN